MMDLGDINGYEYMRPLVQGWLSKIEASLSCGSRKKWKEVSDEAVMFYSKSAAAMWDPLYSKKFWRNVKAPKFRITINKAFELVAVFGPNLMWDMPHRQVTPKKILEIPPESFMALPNGQQMVQMLQQRAAMEASQDKLICHLMQTWQNYTPREQQPDLATSNELAVIDALVKGRGCLWPATYKFPGSERNLVGSFRETPDDLLTDPDSRTLNKCKWIARRHVQAHWEVERRFKLPPGSLKGNATLESAWHYSELQGTDDRGTGERQSGKTNDQVIWYEVWSKTGVGSRMTGMPDMLKSRFEDVIGDYAYLAICPGCPYPLNCPSDKIRAGATDEDVRHSFEWPVPLWTDGRWPVEVLDFYPDPDGSWPIPPLAPAMGELKFLNFLIPWACNRIYSSSRDFWAVLGQNLDDYKKYLEDGEDQVVFPITPTGGVTDIRQAIQVLQQPETRLDVWKIIELVSDLFDKRTGLTEFAYGQNEQGTQDRSAETTKARAQAVGVRPEHMQKKVVAWQSRVATVEGMLSWLFVDGVDTKPLLGDIGAMLWDQYIKGGDFELVCRGMNYEIAASSIRRPNRERDIANLQEVISRWLPVAQAYGVQSGDYTPINGAIKQWGDLHDMDVTPLFFPEKDPNDPAIQMQQEQVQAETEKLKADAQKALADAQKAMSEAHANPAELKMQELQMEREQAEAELAMEIQKMQAELQAKMLELKLKVEEKKAEMAMKAQEHQMDMAFKQQESTVDLAVKKATGQQQIEMGEQQMAIQEKQGQQQLKQSEQQHKQGLQQGKQQTQAKVQSIKAQAAAKPKAK